MTSRKATRACRSTFVANSTPHVSGVHCRLMLYKPDLPPKNLRPGIHSQESRDGHWQGSMLAGFRNNGMTPPSSSSSMLLDSPTYSHTGKVQASPPMRARWLTDRRRTPSDKTIRYPLYSWHDVPARTAPLTHHRIRRSDAPKTRNLNMKARRVIEHNHTASQCTACNTHNSVK